MDPGEDLLGVVARRAHLDEARLQLGQLEAGDVERTSLRGGGHHG
jgi:hypothetical protein